MIKSLFLRLSPLIFTANFAFGADIIIPLYDEAFGRDDDYMDIEEFLDFLNLDSILPPSAQADTESAKQNASTSSLSLHYLNGYMRHKHFDITLHGLALEYNTILLNTPKSDIVLSYNFNVANASLRPRNAPYNISNSNMGLMGVDSIESTRDKSSILGTFATLDMLFNQTHKGYHALSFDFGYSTGLKGQSSASSIRGVSEFDEHSLMLNAEYGYGFINGLYTLIPYLRVESYVFFPNRAARSNFHRRIDGGMNAIFGLKHIWDTKWLELGLNMGALSDFNISGNSVGVLANGNIVYDSDGVSNGIFSELSFGILRFKHFHLIARTNIGYMLSYYELNIQSDVSLMWRF
ncbi:hypothetical protein LS71_000410 [Helicobacter jaachi]|uniref:Autotransporter outer membrane beta-barrel domain-containing protein n=1 Tax=Helicobacter jaachi TaxID=1677920 RepID=A0A4U8TBI1_9HELI|nr:hypothetical protein [Helicobacter jaachi]TLD97259.1 hypothetical protein LS71_000410 [Helicobacter jaachi]